MKVYQPTRRLGVEAKAQGIQKIVKPGRSIHTLTLPHWQLLSEQTDPRLTGGREAAVGERR
jgi:hypothetical protein